MESLVGNALLSVGGAALSTRLIREFFPIFLRRNLYGIDRCKRDPVKVPEPMGVIIATVYLVVMFLFIPIPFYGWLSKAQDDSNFPYHYFVEFLSGLMAICCMILLGFADDIFDLRWRHKLMLPSLASLPLLMVYAANGNSTTILLPKQITYFTGFADLDIGFMYYVYMGMLAVFCTNAINILAGVNGLEAGQSLIIASSILLYNFLQLWRGDSQTWYQLLSIYYLVPYVCTTAVLFTFNWYPAQVFVGDTFCYWSGMTLAVVGIQGHFSKTLLLFFIPQIVNFVLSAPQLFALLPCPRHRMPTYDAAQDKVAASWAEFKDKDMKMAGRAILWVLEKTGLCRVERSEKDGEAWVRMSNLTLIVLVLQLLGPMHEQRLATLLLGLQVAASALAFLLRFWLAGLFYDVVR